MSRRGAKQLMLGATAAALVAVTVGYAVLFSSNDPRRPTHHPKEQFRPPGPADQPHVEVNERHELARVQHKDANGNSPLETVNTPNGMVTIQRTFSADGALLKEEAFLGGEPVPVPASKVVAPSR